MSNDIEDKTIPRFALSNLGEFLGSFKCWRVAIAFAIGATAGYFYPGNPITEAAEQYIGAETGYHIQLD